MEPQQIDSFLNSIQSKGVRLYLEGERLRFRAPKNAITPEDLIILRELSQDLPTLSRHIERKTTDGRRVGVGIGCAPLSFSQRQHIDLYRLLERPAFRHLASVRRLRGDLDISALERSVAAVVRRHDILRTQIATGDGSWTQEVAESGDWAVRVLDLAARPAEERELEIHRQIEAVVLEPINILTGPLFGVRLLRLDRVEHVLIVAMEHAIADEWSLDIFWRDVLAAYAQLSRGEAATLPPLEGQFSDYAIWQNVTQPSRAERHGAYWQQLIDECHRVPFPVDTRVLDPHHGGWATVPVTIGQDLHEALKHWCRRNKTTVVMAIFAAYAASVMRWCGVSDLVFRYETNGRVSEKFAHTIGYFTSPLFVRLKLSGNENLYELLRLTIEQYCTAHLHADLSYMEAIQPRPGFTRNTAFNWIPKGAKVVSSAPDNASPPLSWKSVPFVNPVLKVLERDVEPFGLFYDTDDGIVGCICYPLRRFSEAEMNRFGRNVVALIRLLLEQPETHISSIAMCD
jgi:hypothetical protein